MPDPAALSTLTTFLNAISVIGVTAAAGFAAWSAWIARSSAKIAMEGVEEARLARKAQIAPRLVLERDFLDFHFVYPHAGTLNGEAVFLARRHWKDTEPTPPTFLLMNCGAGPAIEVQIVFEFEDPNGDYYVPPMFIPAGLSIMAMPTLSQPETVQSLQFQRPNGKGGAGLPLYRKWTTDIPNCAPGQTRTIEFPQHLLNTLFLRGLQYWDRRGSEDAVKDITLVVRLNCYTAEGDRYSTQFRFAAFPFWQGQSDPLIVCGHFRELPMYEQEDGPRVA